MTVHAAKGLEFPVLFLVNLGKGSGGTRAPIRLTAGSDEVEPSVGIGELESDTDEDAAARDKEETKRLLYVAITRARERVFLSAVVAGDRFRPARGSLGEVLPATLQDAITRAAAAQIPEVSWMGASRTHRLRVCRTVSEPAAPARAASDPGAADLALVGDEVPTRYETAAGAPDRLASAARAGGDPAVATLAGKLVHRVLEHLSGGEDDDRRAVEGRIRTLIAPMEALDAEVTEAAVARAIELCAAIRRPSVRALLAGGVCAHEVPFSLQLDGREVASELEGGAIARAGSGASGNVRSGDRVVVRGTIDTLVERTDDVVVVEFKTGSARPEHEAQARVYMRAAAALFPGTTVRGVVVYPSAEVWLD
jgi:ATP-dependent helicase/nuclease subunit A